MKTIHILYILLLYIATFTSCKQQTYLPTPEAITQNPFGSYIKVKGFSGKNIKNEGELIAVNRDSILVLSNKLHSVVAISQRDILEFKLIYAKTYNYKPTILLGAIVPIIPIPGEEGCMPCHGYYALISVPLNLVVTGIVAITADMSYTYTNTQISYNELKMFARFPQGIPPHIKRTDIK